MNCRLLPILLLTALALRGADAVPAVTLPHTEHRTIASAQIGQTYDLFVSLPEDYATSGKSYPVLFVLDGWHFPFMAALQNNNVYSGRMPPVIIVNLGHGRNVNPMPLRARDFTPTRVAAEPTSGGAAAFLAFLEKEIIPLIDRTYRTNPADRGLLGHSLGGLFALYVLEERPGLFQRIVAASPVADWDHDLLFKGMAKLKNLPHPVRLDLSTGDDEHDVYGFDITAATTAFARKLDELKPTNLEYRFTSYPGENHNSVRFASFAPGLYWVYRPAGTP
jgi:predicted alpha/beta superfamily hydrolase